MEEAPYIEWLSRQGHHVIKTNSSFWYDIGPKVYQSFPYHQLITPSDDEISDFFKKSSALAIRYSTPLYQSVGQISYHVVYENDDYQLAQLPKKARHDVARGLEYASYGVIPLKRLADEGWKLRSETLVRQGRSGAETRQFWEDLCLSAEGLQCFEAWGAQHEGELVAALFACTIGDTVSIYYQQSLTQHLKFGINNTLTYVFTREVLKRPEVKSIFYGLHSLDAPSSVDDFKFRMGYFPKPLRQRVVFNPYVVPLVQPISYLLLKALVNKIPGGSKIAKAEGIVRFYIQGKRSLAEQDWPEALRDQKQMILASSG